MITTRQIYKNAAIGKDANVLKDIHLLSKNIAIYKRSLDSLKTELDDLTKQSIECRASGTVEEILVALKKDLQSLSTRFPRFFADVAALMELFQDTSQTSSFRLLLTTVSTNMCRRFHTDINDLRLLCTYAGPGTLWIPDDCVNRDAYQAGGHNHEIIPEEEHIQQAETGDVVILKGALYPEAQPILHRSPSIEEIGETRLLLRIDTNSNQNLWE